MFRSLCVSTLIAVVVVPVAQAGDEQPARQFVIRIVVNESFAAAQPAKTRKLAEPAIIVTADREAIVHVGGEQAIGDEKVEFGTRARIRVRDSGTDKVGLRGMLEVSELLEPGDQFIGRRSFAAYFNKTVALGKTVRIELPMSGGEQHWIEISIELAESKGDADSAVRRDPRADAITLGAAASSQTTTSELLDRAQRRRAHPSP